MNITIFKSLGSPEGPINTQRGEAYLAHAIRPGTTEVIQIWTPSPTILALQPGERFLVFSKERDDRVFYSFAGTAKDFPEFFEEAKPTANPVKNPPQDEPNF